jgi:vanillate monooxygenase ferredoxin subunit
MAHRPAPSWERATVRSSTTVAESIRHILLDMPGTVTTPAGAHINVLIPTAEGTQLERSYSIVDDGRTPDALGIAVRLAPHSRGGSAFMHRLRAGNQITVSRPVQNFELTPDRPGYVLLAGGIGITPMISMARALRRRAADYQLLYAGRTRTRMAFLDQLQADHPGRIRAVISEAGEHLDCAKLVADIPDATELYVCGPPTLLVAIQREWHNAGRPPGLLRFETFGSGGNLPTLPFDIHVPRIGVRARVPADQTAVQALERAGAEVMSDCLRGECGLCVAPILAADGPIDHRDVFLSPRQKAANADICLCVSRLAGGTLTIDLP